MTQKKRLGRGLEHMLSSSLIQDISASTSNNNPPASGNNLLTYLAVEKIQSGRYQPRTEFDPDSLQELAQSIKEQGIIQPIVVRPISDNRYEIIAGERRWRAAKRAELTDVPVIIKNVDDDAAMAMALIENIQREDLNPLEEARGYQRLLHEFALTHEQIAAAVGRSRSAITNMLRLLKLTPEVRTMLENGDLEMGHAKVLLSLEGVQQITAARIIIDKSLSVRETEALVQNFHKPFANKQADQKADPNIIQLESRLADILGAKVQINCSDKGKGKLVIQYNSLDELDGILNHIK